MNLTQTRTHAHTHTHLIALSEFVDMNGGETELLLQTLFGLLVKRAIAHAHEIAPAAAAAACRVVLGCDMGRGSKFLNEL
jgi:hypothetical protein